MCLQQINIKMACQESMHPGYSLTCLFAAALRGCLALLEAKPALLTRISSAPFSPQKPFVKPSSEIFTPNDETLPFCPASLKNGKSWASSGQHLFPSAFRSDAACLVTTGTPDGTKRTRNRGNMSLVLLILGHGDFEPRLRLRLSKTSKLSAWVRLSLSHYHFFQAGFHSELQDAAAFSIATGLLCGCPCRLCLPDVWVPFIPGFPASQHAVQGQTHVKWFRLKEKTDACRIRICIHITAT